MDYSPWGRKESHMTERLSLSLSDGQSFNLTHASRNLLEHSQNGDWWVPPSGFPFPLHQGTSISQEGDELCPVQASLWLQPRGTC